MAHEPAGAHQETAGICDLGPAKEPDIDVSREGIDVGKRGVAHTRGRMPIVQQLSNIIAAGTHDLEPMPRDGP